MYINLIVRGESSPCEIKLGATYMHMYKMNNAVIPSTIIHETHSEGR